MICCYREKHIENTISWISPIVNSSDAALRATTGQEGWGRFCHVVYVSLVDESHSISTDEPG